MQVCFLKAYPLSVTKLSYAKFMRQGAGLLTRILLPLMKQCTPFPGKDLKSDASTSHSDNISSFFCFIESSTFPKK